MSTSDAGDSVGMDSAGMIVSTGSNDVSNDVNGDTVRKHTPVTMFIDFDGVLNVFPDEKAMRRGGITSAVDSWSDGTLKTLYHPDHAYKHDRKEKLIMPGGDDWRITIRWSSELVADLLALTTPVGSSLPSFLRPYQGTTLDGTTPNDANSSEMGAQAPSLLRWVWLSTWMPFVEDVLNPALGIASHGQHISSWQERSVVSLGDDPGDATAEWPSTELDATVTDGVNDADILNALWYRYSSPWARPGYHGKETFVRSWMRANPGRPFIWIDDEDVNITAWRRLLRDYGDEYHMLLVQPNPEIGISRSQMAVIRGFVAAHNGAGDGDSVVDSVHSNALSDGSTDSDSIVITVPVGITEGSIRTGAVFTSEDTSGGRGDGHLGY